MTSIRLLKNGSEAFPAMFAAMDSAQLSIAVEMYIVANDGTGQEFRTRLISAAERGVRVMVLVDAWGSRGLPDDFWKGLLAAGGMVRAFHPLSKGLITFRNHRKLILIDNRIAYIGGMNIADEYYRGTPTEAAWRDNMLEISGRDVVRLLGSFSQMWAQNESLLRRFLSRIKKRRAATVFGVVGTLLFLESGPENSMRPARKAYREVIRGAAREIDIAMGYFYPHGRLLRTLKHAARQGVRVRLLFSRKTDVQIARWAACGLYGRLLRSGIEVWEYEPAMMHAKLVIADDTVIAGSANLDIRSGRINYELVAVAIDPTLAARARADFEDDLKQSVRIRIEDWRKRPLLQKLKERFSYCLLVRADLLIARFEMSRRMR